jgi:hypothetical protein
VSKARTTPRAPTFGGGTPLFLRIHRVRCVPPVQLRPVPSSCCTGLRCTVARMAPVLFRCCLRGQMVSKGRHDPHVELGLRERSQL